MKSERKEGESNKRGLVEKMSYPMLDHLHLIRDGYAKGLRLYINRHAESPGGFSQSQSEQEIEMERDRNGRRESRIETEKRVRE